jgi:hypothetical protein
MIGVPFHNNDTDCLAAISEVMAELVAARDPLLVELTEKYRTTEALAAWIRSLPQRDDDGDPKDGPKVDACEPVQRLRIPAPDPNCVERAALYLGVAELLDPQPMRQLATLDYSWGRHTFPLEYGVPIVLDPRVNAEDLAHRLAAGEAGSPRTQEAAEIVHEAPVPQALETPKSRRKRSRVAIDVRDAIDYTAQLAEEGTRNLRNGPSRVWLARNAIQNLIDSGTVPIDTKTVDTIGWFFSVAAEVARTYGPRALMIARTTAAAITDLIDDMLAREQRNLSFDFGGSHYSVPSWLADIAGTVGKIGLDLGAAYVRPYLLGAGVTAEMLNLVEQELNSEGYSLGPLAKQNQSISAALAALNKGK